MTGMLIVVGFLVVVFASALVIAEFADRRRSRELAADRTRFTQPDRDPALRCTFTPATRLRAAH